MLCVACLCMPVCLHVCNVCILQCRVGDVVSQLLIYLLKIACKFVKTLSPITRIFTIIIASNKTTQYQLLAKKYHI